MIENEILMKFGNTKRLWNWTSCVVWVTSSLHRRLHADGSPAQMTISRKFSDWHFGDTHEITKKQHTSWKLEVFIKIKYHETLSVKPSTKTIKHHFLGIMDKKNRRCIWLLISKDWTLYKRNWTRAICYLSAPSEILEGEILLLEKKKEFLLFFMRSQFFFVKKSKPENQLLMTSSNCFWTLEQIRTTKYVNQYSFINTWSAYSCVLSKTFCTLS